jgi:2-polyprenyl-3-methyl-5-hydroxy-6-metoxy-1,4-benzoquinol methylase
MTDPSNGYEGIAAEFLTGRGRAPATGVGAKAVREWASTLSHGAAVIDIGCGSGIPITRELVNQNLNVYAMDASPSMVSAFRRNFPNTPVACESVQDSLFFIRRFDAVLSWGLMFLLQPDQQHHLIQRFAEILVPGGRLLFTSEREQVVWNDAMTGLESRSLGATEYKKLLSAVGLSVTREYEDEGDNHYYDAVKNDTNTVW